LLLVEIQLLLVEIQLLLVEIQLSLVEIQLDLKFETLFWSLQFRIAQNTFSTVCKKHKQHLALTTHKPKGTVALFITCTTCLLALMTFLAVTIYHL